MVNMNSQPTVARFLSDHFQQSGKSIEQVAIETGGNSTIIKMIFSGTAPLTTSKIVVMANALGIEPGDLCKMVVQEYLPGLWDTIDDCFGIEAAMATSR